MRQTRHDPTDHFWTTLPHTGESFINGYSWPGLLSIVLGVISIVGCVAAAAYRHTDWMLTTGIVGVMAIAGGIAWLILEHRRVLDFERRWLAEHPECTNGGGSHEAMRRRSNGITASASATGSTGCMTTPSTRDHRASHTS